MVTATKSFADTVHAGVCYGEHKGRYLTHFCIGLSLIALTPFDGGIPSLLGGSAEIENSVHSIQKAGRADLVQYPEHHWFK